MIYDNIGIFYDLDCFIVEYKRGNETIFARQCKTFLEVVREICIKEVEETLIKSGRELHQLADIPLSEY